MSVFQHADVLCSIVTARTLLGEPHELQPAARRYCEQVYDTGTQGWIAIGAGVVAAGLGTTLFLWKGKEATGAVAVAPGALMLRGQF